MAALDDSLTKFEGKLWTFWTRNSGISNCLSKWCIYEVSSYKYY